MSARALIIAQIEAIKNVNLVLTRRLRRAEDHVHVMEQDRADIHEAIAQNRRLIEELEKHL